MNQSRLESAIEVASNIAVGFSINLIAVPLIFPLFGYYIGFGENVGIGIVFTFISIARQYVIRRCFNGNLGRWVALKVTRAT